MNVEELIEHLQKMPKDLNVYTAIDAEGNGYNETYFPPVIMWKLKEEEIFGDIISAEQENLDDLEITKDDVDEIVVI